MNQDFKDVTVQGVGYRLGVFTPTIGGFIMLQTKSMMIDLDIYTSVLHNCLDVVALLKEKDGQKFPFKLFDKTKTRWIEPEIKNPTVLNELMMQVVNFNLLPFIEPSPEQKDSSTPLDSPQQSSPMASAPTLGGQS